MTDENLDRRNFLKAVAATAAAATVTGAGAGIVMRQLETPAVPPAAPLVRTVTEVVDYKDEVTTLRARMINSETENVRLRAELDSALRRLEAQTSAGTGTGKTIETLQGQLSEAGSRMGVLAGLLAMYEQLDDIDLGGLLAGGLEAVDGFVDDLTGDLPTLAEGLARGQQALTDFEAEVPLLSAAHGWLREQFARLEQLQDAALGRLRTAVDNIGDFLQMLGAWFADVLRWLPFGRGDDAAQVVEALTAFVREATDAVAANGAATQPLTVWFSPDPQTREAAVASKVIRPLREQALQPAGALVARAETVKSGYKSALADPARARLTERAMMYDLIAQYRTEHEIERHSA